ncbi:PH domain-containing protein [Blastococcus colisei]|uniref:PH domain-containing protein n=1 Tax=Blastococcus colisei TaxID=1564162 RepID=UPI0014775747|nr:PH domain-containing protein [Blastococcus colisei]
MTAAEQPSEQPADWTITAQPYQHLPSEAKVVWHIENVVTTTIALLLAVVAFYIPAVPDSWQPLRISVAAAVLAIGLFEAIVLIPRRYRYYEFQVAEDHVAIRRGRLFRRLLVLPLHQILFVETRQGPALARYGLVKVQLGTIAEHHALGPVPPTVAVEVRTAVQRRGGSRD